ncbi:MAG: class I SAM-dependent methyltransferase [Nanoarchaeota archaeon]
MQFKDLMDIPTLDKYIADHIQGGFGQADMAVMKEECEKLKPGDLYVEIGVDEGRSARVAHEYCPEGVYKIFIDIHDHGPVPNVTISRAVFMEQEGMVGLGKTGFYIHGDADEFSKILLFIKNEYWDGVNLLFIDGHHDYKSVKWNTLNWEGLVAPGGVILFHDYDHPETKRWLDEHYGDKKEVLHNKIVRVRK